MRNGGVGRALRISLRKWHKIPSMWELLRSAYTVRNGLSEVLVPVARERCASKKAMGVVQRGRKTRRADDGKSPRDRF